MLTECPQCQTQFIITDEQLQRASGSIRCERCNTVFVASPATNEHTAELEVVSVDAIELDDSTKLDAVELEAGDIDIPDMSDSPELDTPELAPVDNIHVDDIELPESPSIKMPTTPVSGTDDRETDIVDITDTDKPRPPTAEVIPLPSLPDSKAHVLSFNTGQAAANADQLVDVTTAAPPMDENIVESGDAVQDSAASIETGTGALPESGYDPRQLYPELETRATGMPEHATGYIIASIALIMVFILQSIYLLHDELAEQAAVRPFIQDYCETFGCSVKLPREPDAIVLREREIRSHPNVAGALSVTAQIENTARFRQSYPVLQLQFRDIAGHIVAGRNFQPNEYLPEDVSIHSGIAPGNPVNVGLELGDPGNKAVSYLFIFK